jgi:acyl-CoA synthetase (AMP-forming)/AMP-acid ligase II
MTTSSASGSACCVPRPTVLIGIANGPDERRRRLPRGLRVITAGAPPAAATIERVEGELGWQITHVYGLTETAPFITVCEARRRTRSSVHPRSRRRRRGRA